MLLQAFPNREFMAVELPSLQLTFCHLLLLINMEFLLAVNYSLVIYDAIFRINIEIYCGIVSYLFF